MTPDPAIALLRAAAVDLVTAHPPEGWLVWLERDGPRVRRPDGVVLSLRDVPEPATVRTEGAAIVVSLPKR